MTESSGLDFLVNRGDWNDHRFDENPKPVLTSGQILFRVDRFAFTANNISYAVAGDMLGYWRFFPAPDGWGRLPVMGYGEVVGSERSGVSVGTRCFGFYPMSRYVVIEPSHAGPDLIIEGAPHRTRFVSTSEGFGVRLGGAELTLGSGRIAEELRSLGLPKRALMSTWMERMRARFEAPEKL